MKTKKEKIPMVWSLQWAKSPRHNIIAWAQVENMSEPGFEFRHLVTVESVRGRAITHCGCAAKLFNPRATCIHGAAVENKMKKKLDRILRAQ